MGRLRAMPPRLQAHAPARLAARVDHGDERSRDAAAPYRRWYKTASWQRLRWSILVRDDLVCAMCGAEHELTPMCRALKRAGRPDLVQGRAPDRVADHRRPHRGDVDLFHDPANLQCLCKACHDRPKQRQDRREGGV